MRELKFRIWNGDSMVDDITIGKFGVFYVNPGDKKNGLDPKDTASLTPFTTKYHEGIHVMQYTGLKDKNGVELYEGDILQWPDGDKGAIFYDENLSQFRVGDSPEVSAQIYINIGKKGQAVCVGHIYQKAKETTLHRKRCIECEGFRDECECP